MPLLLFFACRPEHVESPNVRLEDLADTADATPLGPPDAVCFCDIQAAPAFAPLGAVSNLGRIHDPGGTDFSWTELDPDQDGRDLDFTRTDASISRTQAFGMSQWVTLHTDRTEDGLLAPLRLPPDRAAWDRFVRALVERYDGDGFEDMPGLVSPVVAWEVGNEPEEVMSPQDYAELVTITAASVHAADPDALVLNGGTKPLDTESGPWVPWWTEFLQLGGAEGLDRFQVHEGVGSGAPVEWTLDVWLQLLEESAPALADSVWIGEMGPVDWDGSTGVHGDLAGWTEEHLKASLERVERACVCASNVLVQPEWEPVLEVIGEVNGR